MVQRLTDDDNDGGADCDLAKNSKVCEKTKENEHTNKHTSKKVNEHMRKRER